MSSTTANTATYDRELSCEVANNGCLASTAPPTCDFSNSVNCTNPDSTCLSSNPAAQTCSSSSLGALNPGACSAANPGECVVTVEYGQISGLNYVDTPVPTGSFTAASVTSCAESCNSRGAGCRGFSYDQLTSECTLFTAGSPAPCRPLWSGVSGVTSRGFR
ncbi:hypothetical protein COCOBI_06-5930 [Coccomyxa sp. Obi]|nr:hypothetical protein COCOBI_06-5930 [Coccomyxa sp. Obi]